MAEPRKFVIIVFPMGFQGKLWSTILRSQNLSVIWESADVPIVETLKMMKSQVSSLPDMLILDTRLRSIRPYFLCRWCQHHVPDVKVVLVNGGQQQIMPPERQWAICQGAADLLPCFRRESVISRAVMSLRQIHHLLGDLPLDQRQLVSSLLKIGLGPPVQSAQPSPVEAKFAVLSSQESVP